MKKINKIILISITALFITLIFPTSVLAAPSEDDRTIFGSSYTLESGHILDGNLNVVGGIVNIEEGAKVNGDMLVLGGLVDIDGTIQGNLTVIGGNVTLMDHAVIKGNLVSPASYITREPGAVIEGDQIEGWDIPWTNHNFPMMLQPNRRNTPSFGILPFITNFAKGTLLFLVLVALGALMLLVMPKPTEVMTDALTSDPWPVLGYGALTMFVAVVGGILLSLTICLIPVVILGWLAIGLAVLAGWLALGYELGKRIGEGIFKTTWHSALSAIVGNSILFLVARGLDLIPCLGPFIVFVAMLFGLGMVVITLFGNKPYPMKTIKESEQQIIINTGDMDQLQEDRITEVLKQEDITQNKPIEALGLDTRTTKILKDAGFSTIDDIITSLENGAGEISKINGFGPKSFVNLTEALQKAGYKVP